MRLNDVLDGLGEALSAVDGLRVQMYWADRVSAPAAVLGWPVTGEYDKTFGRGMDTITVPFLVVVGRVDARSSRDALAEYVNGSGARSIKAAVEQHQTTAWDVAHVTEWQVDAATIGGNDYYAVEFTVTITGKGE